MISLLFNRLLAANDGLASRFAKRLQFPSYSAEELGRIGEVIAKARDSELSSEALQLLIQACDRLYHMESTDQNGQPRRGVDLAGNGRFIRNIVEAAEEEREFRLSNDESLDLSQVDESVLMRIEAPDMHIALGSVLSSLGLGG